MSHLGVSFCSYSYKLTGTCQRNFPGLRVCGHPFFVQMQGGDFFVRVFGLPVGQKKGENLQNDAF